MGLIACPTCYEKGIKQFLGSVTSNGNLVVQRNGKGMTIVQSSEFTIICICGFGTTITNQNSGVVQI